MDKSNEKTTRAESSRAAEEDLLGAGESVSERVGNVFTGYTCGTMTRGVEHPGDIAEAASLSSIQLPPNDYPLHETISDSIIASGKLSKLQLEGVAYACQAHLTKLPGGDRSGFMIGDGAGVGKGRQIAGIVVDNFARGRKRHIWISSSHDLRRDAERDLRDLGCYVKVIDGVKELDKETKALGLSKTCAEGVLFLTYSTLVSKGGGEGKKNSVTTGKSKSRLEQAIEWFVGDTETPLNQKEQTADGCLIFDECHKAKNHSEALKSGSKVAACVIELQKRLVNARVVYCSATGVSEIGNMAYMARLGFWGAGTPFPDSQKFIDAMKHRGVGFLEMLAMEMKSSGKYVSRGLSFKAAEFRTVETKLNANQTASYDAAADFMDKLKACLMQALTETRQNGGQVWKAYWSMHQRLFKLLCVSAKVPEVVALSQAALANGECVVIGMQTTGESAEAWETQGAEKGVGGGGLFNPNYGVKKGTAQQFISTTRAMLRFFVENHFPTHVADVAAPGARNSGVTQAGDGDGDGYFDEQGVWVVLDAGGGNGSFAGTLNSNPKDSTLRPHPTCVQAKEILLEMLESLDLPPNPLDELIDLLGGPSAVAEMTGRSKRVVRRNGVLLRENRSDLLTSKTADAFADSVDGVNVSEKISFQKGQKKVAVISDAASTGISLHARLGEANTSRRVHVTIELPWSADKAIQQLGRTHRSNQSSGPSYVMVSTNLGGEKRFAAAVARRLQSLGALTRGDRRAATGIDLSEGNLDSPLGRGALKKMYDALALRGAGRLDSGGTGLANDVLLANVLSHLPAKKSGEDADETADPSSPDASVYLHEEQTTPGAGVAKLHDELREAVVKTGLQVGLSPVGLSSESQVLWSATGAGAKDVGDVRRFLNRILGLPVRAQNLLFGYFTETLDKEVSVAKADGRYTEGVADLSGSNIRIESTETILKDPFGSGAELKKTLVSIDRGVSFQDSVEMLQKHEESTLIHSNGDTKDTTNPNPDSTLKSPESTQKNPKKNGSGFYRANRDMYGRTQVLLAFLKVGKKNTFTVTRPNTGSSINDLERDDLESKYVRIVDDKVHTDAKRWWDATYAMTENNCMHGDSCSTRNCAIGTRDTRCCIVSGAVVPSWGILEKTLERHGERFPKSDRGMRAARAVAEDGTKVVGIRYPEELLEEVREKLINEWAVRDDLLAGVGAGGGGEDDGRGVGNNETITLDGAGTITLDGASDSTAEGANGASNSKQEDAKGCIQQSPRRSRFEDVTPVDKRCAARAATAPNTMRSFFTTKTATVKTVGDFVKREGDDSGDPKLVGDTKRPRTSIDFTGPLTKKKTKTKSKSEVIVPPGVGKSQSFFTASEKQPSTKKEKQPPLTFETRRQTCPICAHVFPATSLNSDINKHVDVCVENMG